MRSRISSAIILTIYRKIVIFGGETCKLSSSHFFIQSEKNNVPEIQVIFYQEDEENIPVLDWIEETEKMHPDSSLKFIALIERLQEFGHELRRPTADFLRDRIYELRTEYKNVQYRILYFFHESNAILCHAVSKKGDNPKKFGKAIDKAIERMNKYIQDPIQHTYQE